MSYPAAPNPGQSSPDSNQPVPQPNQPQYGQMNPQPAGPGNQPNRPVAPTPGGYGFYQPYAQQRPQPGIIPLGPLSMGEIISGIFKAISTNAKSVIGIPLIVTLPIAAFFTLVQLVLMLIPGLQEYFIPMSPAEAASIGANADGDPDKVFAALGHQLASTSLQAGFLSVSNFIGSIIIVGMLTIVISQLSIGRKATIKQSWEAFKPRFGSLIGYVLLYALLFFGVIFVLTGLAVLVLVLIAVGVHESNRADAVAAILLASFVFLIILLVVSVFITVKFLFSQSAIVLEEATVTGAFKRSWNLTKGQFWRIFGIYIVISLMTGVASSVVTGPLGMIQTYAPFTSKAALVIITSISLFLQILVSGLILAVSCSGTVLLYMDVRMRKENLAESLIAASKDVPPATPGVA